MVPERSSQTCCIGLGHEQHGRTKWCHRGYAYADILLCIEKRLCTFRYFVDFDLIWSKMYDHIIDNVLQLINQHIVYIQIRLSFRNFKLYIHVFITALTVDIANIFV